MSFAAAAFRHPVSGLQCFALPMHSYQQLSSELPVPPPWIHAVPLILLILWLPFPWTEQSLAPQLSSAYIVIMRFPTYIINTFSQSCGYSLLILIL